MPAHHGNSGSDNGGEFYSTPAAVSGYIAHRAQGKSRNSLIEEPAFWPLLGEVRDRDCLDLGCGYGHYTEALADAGARVTGVDRAELMIAEARRRAGPSIIYVLDDIETARFPGESFDVVISNLSFHYVDALDPMFARIFTWLRPGGRLVFTVEHPVFTSAVHQGRWADDGPERQCWIVSDYFHEGERWGEFGLKYHHTAQTWTDAVLGAGFTLTRILEPAPSAAGLGMVPTFAEDLHRPLYLIIACRKP